MNCNTTHYRANSSSVPGDPTAAAQGFAFNGENVAAIWKSFTVDNVQAAGGNKLWNPLVYLFHLFRILGLPVLALACAATPALRRRLAGHRALAIAVLPVLLHGLGIQFIALPFARHLLPLVPLLAILAAGAIVAAGQYRKPLAILAIGWSALLASTDQLAFVSDARLNALAWLAGNVRQDATVAADPYVKLPVGDFYPSNDATRADFIVRHEAWYYRFSRSELSPFGSPPPDRLYHAKPEDAETCAQQQRDLESGALTLAFEEKPVAILPEQIVYGWAWGSLERFAGTCQVLRRAPGP